MKIEEAINVLMEAYWQAGYRTKEIIMEPEVKAAYLKEIGVPPSKTFDIVDVDKNCMVKVFENKAGHFQLIIEPRED